MYENLGNWDFSEINYLEEYENTCDMYDEMKKYANDKESVDKNLFDEYVKNNTTSKGILLKRRYYGIVAKK